MSKFKVGIIGNGFVGEAVAFAMSPSYKVLVHDSNPLRSMNTLDEVCQCDFVFVCVPTPMDQYGNQDISYVNNVFENVSSNPIYILKSTVLPGTTERLIESTNLDIVFSPEFLTERTAKLDMLTQSRIVLGGNNIITEKVEKLLLKRFNNKNIIKTDAKTAELIKYMNNTFFANKN